MEIWNSQWSWLLKEETSEILERSRVVILRRHKLGFKDLDQEHIWYMNLLEEGSRTNISLEIFSAQKEEKEREILMDSKAYMCSRLMEKVLEFFLHLIYALDAGNMKLGWRSWRADVCVFLVCLGRGWGRESGRVCGCLMG